jgi:hypothetical protein
VTDPARFQPREGLDPDKVRDIAQNYDPNEFDPLILWRNPDDPDGPLTVLGGHHRFEAVRELGLGDVDARVVEVDEKTARKIARHSNSQKPMSEAAKANVVRADVEDGTKAVNALTASETASLNISYLPRDMQQLVEVGKQSLLPKGVASVMGELVRLGHRQAEEMFDLYKTLLNDSKTGKLPSADEVGYILEGASYRTEQGGATMDLFAAAGVDAPARTTLIQDLADLGRKLKQVSGDLKAANRLAKNQPDMVQTSGISTLESEIAALNQKLGRTETVYSIGGQWARAAAQTYIQGAQDTARLIRQATQGAGQRTAHVLQHVTNQPPHLAGTPATGSPNLLPDDVVAELNRVWTGHPDPAFRGKTTRQVYDALQTQATKEIDAFRTLQNQGVRFPTARERARPRTLTRDQKRMVEIWERWGKISGIAAENLTATPIEQLAIDQARIHAMVDQGFDPTRGPNALTTFFGATAQTLLTRPYFLSTHYLLQNVIGNQVLTSAGLRTSTGMPVGVLVSREDFRTIAARNQRHIAGVGADPTRLTAYERYFAEMGAPHGPTRAGVTKTDYIEQGSLWRMLNTLRVGKVPIGEGTFADIAKPFEDSAVWIRSVEEAQKKGAVRALAEDAQWEAIPAFRERAVQQAERMGARLGGHGPVARDATARAFDRLPKTFGAARLYDEIYREITAAGLRGKVREDIAERAARDWMNMTLGENGFIKTALREVERVMPGIGQTNIERAMGAVYPFSFYNTRVARYQLEELASHPGLAAALYRYQRGAEQWEEEHPETPWWLKGMIRLSATPFGYTIHTQPMRLFLSSYFEGENGVADGEKLSMLGNALQWIESKTGLQPWPGIQFGLSLAGEYPNQAVPNPFPVPEIRLAGQIIDAVRVWGGAGPGDPIYQRALGAFREKVTEILPGVDTIEAVDPTGIRQEKIASMILEQNPDLGARMQSDDAATRVAAQRELEAIMANPNDERYIEAERIVFTEPVVRTVVNAINPLSFTTRQQRIDETRATARGEPVGPGEAPVPAEERAAEEERDLINTPDPAARRVRMGATEEQAVRDANRSGAFACNTVNAIRYGNLEYGVYIGGIGQERYYSPEEINAMDEGTRAILADIYMGMAPQRAAAAEAYRAERDLVREENPERGRYTAWRSDVLGYEGGPQAWWEAAIQTNPNAARWYREAVPAYASYLEGEGIAAGTPEHQQRIEQFLGSDEAYFAYAGMPGSRHDPTPLAVNDPTLSPINPTAVAEGGGGGNGGWTPQTPEQEARSLAESLATFDAQMGLTNAWLAQGTAPGQIPVTYDAMAPWAQRIYQDRFPGLFPNPPQKVRDYREWQALQPPGADRSVLAFVSWRRAQLDARDRAIAPFLAGYLVPTTDPGTLPIGPNPLAQPGPLYPYLPASTDYPYPYPPLPLGLS